MSEDIEFEYDGDDSLQFIMNFLPESVKQKFSDDEICYVVDLIYDFYELKGLMDAEDDELIDLDAYDEELVAYIIKNAFNDGFGEFEDEDVTLILQGEKGYCNSIGFFE